MNQGTTSPQFNSLQLLQAYERAIDENIITSITDTKGTIVHVNEKFCKVAQYSAAELVGQNHRIINSSFHPREFFTGLWQTIGAGQVWHAEVRNRARDGTCYWVDTVIVPMKDDAHATTHYLSLRTLITERKLAEQEKQKYLSALETLLVMTSHRVRKPLASCLQKMSVLDSGAPTSNVSLHEIVKDLKATAMELEAFTHELTTFIRDMKT